MIASLAALLPPGVSALDYAGMALLVTTSACLQGLGGMGFAVFSAPIAALLYPALVPGPLLALGGPLGAMGIVREFHAVDWRFAGAAVCGRAVGTALAGVLMAWLSATLLSVLFAGLILTGVALSIAGRRVRPTTANIGVAGVASGVMGTITSAGGPPLALAVQDLPPASVRATMGLVFFVGATLSLLALFQMGRFDGPLAWLSLLLMPWMFVGFALSTPLIRRVPARMVRPLLLGLATFGALGVLLQLVLSH